MNIRELQEKFSSLKPGEMFIYYQGYLDRDVHRHKEEAVHARNYAYAAYKRGEVTLTQTRIDTANHSRGFNYIAIGVRRRPGNLAKVEPPKKPSPRSPGAKSDLSQAKHKDILGRVS